MQRCFCDLCGKEILAASVGRYVVRVEGKKVSEPTELTDDDLSGQDEPDHIDAMDELLAKMDDADADDTELELVPPPTTTREFDLCHVCYRQFQADPLGQERVRKLYFSQN